MTHCRRRVRCACWQGPAPPKRAAMCEGGSEPDVAAQPAALDLSAELDALESALATLSERREAHAQQRAEAAAQRESAAEGEQAAVEDAEDEPLDVSEELEAVAEGCKALADALAGADDAALAAKAVLGKGGRARRAMGRGEAM